MPIRGGYVNGAPLVSGQVTAGLSANLSSYQFLAFDPSVFAMSVLSGYDNGGRLRRFAKSLSALHSAYRLPNYTDDFYDRIYIRPNLLELGNLVSEQQVSVEVWNAHRTQKTLQTITPVNAEGVSISGASYPRTWEPLEAQTYLVSVTPDGPPDINAQLLFDWNGTIDDGVLRITGSRIVGLSYLFEAPAKEILEWKTNVITSNQGVEQRIRLRKKPRQGLDVTYPLQRGQLQTAEAMVYGWLGRRWSVPLWTEAQQYMGTLAVGATTVPIDTTSRDYRVGGLIHLFQPNNGASATAEVSAVAAGSLTLARPLEAALVNPWVMPSRVGRVLGNPSRSFNGNNGRLGMIYEFSDNIDLNPPAAPTQYLGYDVYFDEFLKQGEELQDSLITRVDAVDYGLAASATIFSPWLYTRIARPWRFIVQGLPAIWEFRKFLHRRAGRLRPFWTPTWEENLRLVPTSGLVLQIITVYADNYREFAADRTHLAFLLRDGTWLLRTVTSTAADTTPGQTDVVVDSNLNVDASQILMVSFLGLRRFDTDRIELNWDSNRTLTCEIRILEIQP